MRYVSAVPAYGRDYRSAREVQEAWDAGQDFLVQDIEYSGYINKDDKPDDIVLNVRYKNLTMVKVIK